MNPILEQFLAEARENLLYLDKNLENLEDGDGDTVNALFRAAHTLKGSSGLAGFDAVKETTHIAEDLLDAYRNGKIEYSLDLLDTLYDMFDEVTELVDATEESGEISNCDEEKISEFKKQRESLLQVEEVVDDGIDTELIIVDDEIAAFGNYFKNDFSKIDLSKISFDQKPLTKDSFEDMGYYFVDLDLSVETLEIGNDPFYAMYLLENENIISIYTGLGSDCQKIKEDPLQWKTRIVAIVYANQELLEDAFYNFLDEVTIYPLSIKALLNNELELQSNESIVDFTNDLKEMLSNKNFDNLLSSLEAASTIVNPSSCQGFVFSRLEFMLKNNTFSDDILESSLNYIFELIKLQPSEDLIQENLEQTKDVISLNEDEKKVLEDILKQQLAILKTVSTENVLDQVKQTLAKIQTSTAKDFGALECESKDTLKAVISNMATFFNVELKEEVETIEQLDQSIQEKPQIKQNKSESISESKNESKVKASKQIAKTVKIDLEEIDSMMDTVGEMLVIKNSLPYIADALDVTNVESTKRELQAKYDEINRVTTALQEKVMEMRLLSLSFIFDRYPKLVRDISKSLGKKIKYNESGGDTKLDKTIIEKLADPLIHIIRNSLDHGIETPDQREANGKSKEGQITISAKSVGDKVYVTIEDDGRGIDVDKVVHKALDKKMVNPDELDEMSREEKLLLVFHPGVSTMEKISELSGRGVGMDVVRQTIDDIGGKISLQSEINVGTKLTLELPMSVALTNVFHVKLGDANYALAMDTISETVQVAANEVEYVNKKPMLKLRGDLIPLVFNYTLLSKDIKEQDSFSLLIIEADGNKFGFIVNEFVNQLDIIQKPLSSNFKNHPFISGTSLLGNGEVLFVINPIKLINLKEKK